VPAREHVGAKEVRELRERDDAFAVCESLRLVLRWFVF
jgi:hypothetical protein